MDWILISKLIVEVGLPAAQAIYKKWEAGTPPTDSDWNEIKALADQDATARIKARLAAAGIPLTDPIAIALLGLAGELPPTPEAPPAPPS